MQDKVIVANGMIQANQIAQCRDSDANLISRNVYEKAVGKHCSWRNEQSTHAPETAVHVISPAVGGSVNTDVRPTKLHAVTAEFTPSSAHQQTNTSWCAKYIADITGVNGDHMASQGGVMIGNGHDKGAPVGVGFLFGSKQIMSKLQYAAQRISMLCNTKVTQKGVFRKVRGS